MLGLGGFLRAGKWRDLDSNVYNLGLIDGPQDGVVAQMVDKPYVTEAPDARIVTVTSTPTRVFELDITRRFGEAVPRGPALLRVGLTNAILGGSGGTARGVPLAAGQPFVIDEGYRGEVWMVAAPGDSVIVDVIEF